MVHLLPRIIPNHIVLHEFSFQTFIDGAFPKLSKQKRKGWPKFLLSLDSLVLLNYTHTGLMGKEITTMNLGEASKRMHDPKSYMSNLFAQEWVKFQYTHEDLPDDSMYREAIDFHEALENITDLEEKEHVAKYQKDTK